MTYQLDLFGTPALEQKKAHFAEEVSPVEYKPIPGNNWYMAAQELVHYTAYLKLNDWQKQILWPHLGTIVKNMAYMTEPKDLWFELGYLVSAMEIEQLRNRADARKIVQKYGITFK